MTSKNLHRGALTSPHVPEGWRLVRLGDVAAPNREKWDPAVGTPKAYLDLTAVVSPGRLAPPKIVEAKDAPSGGPTKGVLWRHSCKHSSSQSPWVCESSGRPRESGCVYWLRLPDSGR